MLKSSISQSSELSTLSDDEVKRIMSVIERDFKLREKEYKRTEELKDIVRQEHEHTKCLASSKQLNYERCIRCYRLFKIFFNPREECFICKLYICQNCATHDKQTQVWTCKICLELKTLECLTTDWFYLEIAKKYKRCGSAKVVRELHKREKELAETNASCEDLGYGTLRGSIKTDSKDSGFLRSYVVHDENIKSELNEYSERLNSILDSLQSDLAKLHTDNIDRSIRNKFQENLKDHQQQIASEIYRARIALMDPLRRSNIKINEVYVNDLQNLLIHKTEQVLHTNLQQFKKTLATPNSSINSNNFDEKLAQLIFDNYTTEEIYDSLSQTIELPSTFSQVPTKPQRQSSTSFSVDPSSCQLNQNISLLQTSNASLENKKTQMNHSTNTFQKMNSLATSFVDEEDEQDAKTPITSSIEDENSDYQDEKKRFIDTDLDTIQRSNERVDDWKASFDLIESDLTFLDDANEEEELSTWL
ncbi:unnamed protein product [Rotaria magnacalcarata]|uniref:RabBD domain-containing protein n=2 Tax=Rotaria magnacalcarata TaxID=392030 RepID=A0A816GU13_9BILA|nr:unnamed protein product [Rotaria magnacalcarata]CAF2108177.1 unnamed protein product [Rotaria magnacalcarata]